MAIRSKATRDEFNARKSCPLKNQVFSPFAHPTGRAQTGTLFAKWLLPKIT